MSGRYAGVRDTGDLWRLLVAGESAVREVPTQRWEARRFYDPDPRTPGRTNCVRGGFIDDIDRFDPLFFNVSGLEAETMDPQQRLFLEASWTALEDAGYAGDGVSGSNCGVFVGAPASDYATEAQRCGVESDARVLMGNDTAILSARISYLLNLRGPSIALNTACSSSLVAVHLAAQAIGAGQCEMAVAGGVCLFVSPGFYLAASTADMLSPDGECFAFDHRANGFVPGEGVGVVVLKALDAAVRDGDDIRGVILGSDVNQDGKTNGITAPSARAQHAVQVSAYRRAGITPDTIGMLEAHGTGTALGDPIEIEALSRSFAETTDRTGFCAIGSIKTNIGHTGQAAGVAGLLKIMLAFEHETIPPTRNFERPNSRIDFDRSPFRVATEPTPWPRTLDTPRRAAVSSFGYSGTNAHVVVEERPERVASEPVSGSHLVLLSGKTDAALRSRMGDLVGWLDAHGVERSLRDIAFTLHVGRKHFTKRAAFVAADTAGLRAAIGEALRAESPACLAAAEDRAEAAARLRVDLAETVRGGPEWTAVLGRAAAAFEQGVPVDPAAVYPGLRGDRVPLPTYPFARERYWSRPLDVPAGGAGIALDELATADGGTAFAYRPRADDPLIAGHVVEGTPILAAMVSLELARTAAELSGRGEATALRDVTWRRPLAAAEPAGLHVRLSPSGEFVIDAAQRPASGPGAISGVITWKDTDQSWPSLRVDELRTRLPRVLDAEGCYRRFGDVGIHYGPAFRVLRELRAGEGEVLAALSLPDDTPSGFGFHPTLLDGALQALIALDSGSGLHLPHSLRSARRRGPLPPSCVAHLRRADAGTLDIDVANIDGHVLVALRGLRVAEVPRQPVTLLRPVWLPADMEVSTSSEGTAVLVLDDDDQLASALAEHEPGAQIVLAVPGTGFDQAGPRSFAVRPGSAEDLRLLLDALPGVALRRVVVRWGTDSATLDHHTGLHTLIAVGQACAGSRARGPVSVRFVQQMTGESLPPRAAALGGAARTLRREDPDLLVQVVGVADAPERHARLLLGDVTVADPTELLVDADGAARVVSFEPVEPAAGVTEVRADGVYLISGGAGAVGTAIAGHLADRGGHVVLLGRSPRPDPVRTMENDGSVEYVQADVADRAALATVIDEIRARRGPVRGIVHAAGVVRDSFLRDKTVDSVEQVLAGKVAGALWLDELTSTDPVDFMVLCSSAVAVVGNPGQLDYAHANAFLDAFAAERAARPDSGRTVSIGWPAWAGAGMAAAAGATESAISVPEALTVLDRALTSDAAHLLAVKTDPHRIPHLLSPNAGRARETAGVERGSGDLRQVAEDLLVRVLAEELRVPRERIDAAEPLETYGIDSVMVIALSRRLEDEFGPLPKTLFFEYLTIAELAGYFAERHVDRLGAAAVVERTEAATTTSPSGERTSVPGDHSMGDIAIIGIAGRYPLADDLDALWRNVLLGRDCVTEIPGDRWALAGFFDERPAPGLSYSKWGGFLSDVDKFDPVFFGIAPREADMIDPQERVFLETAWHTLEDAGYSPSALRGQDTGVFVGVMYGHYQLLGSAADGRMPVSSFASIANRVSYVLDFHGPSIALDTMCSSSLTAIHLACAALRRGECHTALAGGVNLSLHPDKYRQLSLGGFASTDGRCRSFGADGDGYVPGEGVGALLLKPLAQALADGDHVHAVIRGSALNHGGKTNGYTVPNPRAQAAAITAALREAGAAPEEIGYVEAHGTGTALGDPIEVNALTRAYGNALADGRRIPIGSAKSAIGHLESAAGIAAITKVVLQLRHRMLPPTLHADMLNPNIDFAASPLRVHRETAPWEPSPGYDRRTAGISSFGAGGANAHVILSEGPSQPDRSVGEGPWALVLSAKSQDALRELATRLAVLLDGRTRSVADAVATDLLHRARALLGLRPDDLRPRDSLAESGFDEVVRAKLGVELADAYGMPVDDLPTAPDTVAALAADLVAGHETRLRAHFDIAEDRGGSRVPDLADAAYTLQVGREAMAHRVAVVAATHAEAVVALTSYAAGGTSVLTGQVGVVPVPEHVGESVRDRAAAWVLGAAVGWAAHADGGRRVPLVHYPFARERHWLDPAEPAAAAPVPVPVPPAPPPVVEEAAGPMSPADLLAHVEGVIRGLAADAIGLSPDRFDPLVNLGDYGFESLTFKTLGDRVAERFGVEFSPTVFFERSGLRGASQWLVDEHGPDLADRPRQAHLAPEEITVTDTRPRVSLAEPPHGNEPIAVIGMSGKFPGAADLDGYWTNLAAQRDLVTEIPADRWDWRELDRDDLPPEQRVPFHWGAFLDGVDEFDPLFFGISPAEAEMMDPQQRLLLQTAWAAIEDAGYRPSAFAGQAVGLFAGIQFNDYQHLLHEAGVLNAQAALGNEHSISVNRISYLLDLRGPSEPVNTACSSSLVAVHRAVRSLRLGESTVALAGGIALNLSSHSTVAAGMMGLLSPDGRCKTLSSGANGYVKGEGVGLLVLKPLSRALADGDDVRAVIRATAVNHGGRAASLTAPNSTAQAALIHAAVTEAGVSPDSIGYLELHGTGTELGDPVEINGITSAFRRLHADHGLPAPEQPYCGIGSVKTNIGHLEPASGIAGLIKIIQSVRHRTLAGMAHLGEVNPYVRLDRSPFRIVDKTVPWERANSRDGVDLPLRAGVSSFGFGGVNAHVFIEEHTPADPAIPPHQPTDQVFVLSARTEEALTAYVGRLAARIDEWTVARTGPAPEAVAMTLQRGREEFAHRLAVVAPDLATLRGRLATVLGGDRPGAGVHRGVAADGTALAGTSADDLAWSWVRGATVDWAAGRPPGATRRVPLPTYPFATKRYWFTAPDRPALTAVGPVAGGAVSGEESVRMALRAILLEKLKLSDDELEDGRDLKDFGVDSILSAMIMQVVQEKFGVQVSLSALVDHPTLAQLAKHIFVDVLDGVAPEVAGVTSPAPRKDTGLRFPPELLPINTQGTGQTSFWVHGAAGYSSWFDGLSRALGPEYPLYAFQARGTDGHSMPQLMDEMAEHYVTCIRMVQPEGPYVIGGYSFGGLVAVEIARRLSAEGETIRHLIMFDTYPAVQEVFDRHVGIYDEDFLRFYLINYFLKIDEHPERAIRPDELRHLPGSLREHALCRLAKDRGQKRISADDIYLYLRGGLNCSAHAEGMYQTYEMRPYAASDVLFFKATDGFTGRASAAYWPETRILDGYDYLTPWSDVVEQRFHSVELENDHLNMLEEPTLDIAARHIGAILREPPAVDEQAYSRFRDGFEAVTAFGHDLLADRFRDRAALSADGDGVTRADLRERLAVGPGTGVGRLFEASVDILFREGYLTEQDDRLYPTAELSALSEDDIATHGADLADTHPEAADYLPLLVAAQAGLPAVLRGEKTGTDVLMPGGSMALVAELYKGNVQSEYYNRLVADCVLDRVRRFTRRFPHSTAQIFEVGAGTGGTSEFVFDAVAAHADRIRYFYTDIGAAFVQAAGQRFDLPYAQFLTHDIERPAEPQGFESHSMDLVVASNVLHATRRIADTVGHCARLLKPGGALVINELTHRLDYNTLTFGLTDGWWLFEDDEQRIPGSPLLAARTWRTVLAAAGLTEVEIHGVPGACEDDQAQCVIVATRGNGQRPEADGAEVSW